MLGRSSDAKASLGLESSATKDRMAPWVKARSSCQVTCASLPRAPPPPFPPAWSALGGRGGRQAVAAAVATPLCLELVVPLPLPACRPRSLGHHAMTVPSGQSLRLPVPLVGPLPVLLLPFTLRLLAKNRLPRK